MPGAWPARAVIGRAERRIGALNGSAGAQGGRALISQFWRFGQSV